MQNNLERLLEESIKAELNVSDLYLIFHHAFEVDADFWWRLVIEERNHAALLKSAREMFFDAGKFPAEMLEEDVEAMIDFNQNLLGSIEQFRKLSPSREDAFSFAMELETSASEAHYQAMMTLADSSRLVRILQELNNEDKNHARRIRHYIGTNNIAVKDGLEESWSEK